MEKALENTPARQLAGTAKQMARLLFTIGGNRVQLFLVEMQEERERLLVAILLVLGVAACGFLFLLALNAVLVMLFWNYSPVLILLILAALYALGAGLLYRRLARLLREWKMLPASLQQLQKDFACLEKKLI